MLTAGDVGDDITVQITSFQINSGSRTSRHSDYTWWAFLNQVSSSFSCSAERCNSVLLWSSRTVQWTTTLHLTLYHQEEEVNYSFWMNCSFKQLESKHSNVFFPQKNTPLTDFLQNYLGARTDLKTLFTPSTGGRATVKISALKRLQVTSFQISLGSSGFRWL